jgi:hypothetical protein
MLWTGCIVQCTFGMEENANATGNTLRGLNVLSPSNLKHKFSLGALRKKIIMSLQKLLYCTNDMLETGSLQTKMLDARILGSVWLLFKVVDVDTLLVKFRMS